MTGIDWADDKLAQDAFWADCPDVAGMDIETRELWHAFAAVAELRALQDMQAANRGRSVRKVVVG